MAKTNGHGNPNWNRDETILALDLYLSHDGDISQISKAEKEALSLTLQGLPYHATSARTETFRNEQGVGFKLMNIRNVATGKGLQNVSAMDKMIWSELGNNKVRVQKLAKAIRDASKLNISTETEEEFCEGKILSQLHFSRERDKKIRKSLITNRLKRGELRCDACNETSKAKNNELKDASFECHHLLPLASGIVRATKLSDMALLCASCHNIIHRLIATEKKWLSITELKLHLN